MENKYNNLKVGQIYKSYRQVCEALCEDVRGGSSKMAQIKEWNCYFKYEKDGNKFIIKEIYTVPLKKEDGRGGGFNRKYHSIRLSHPDVIKHIRDSNGHDLNDITMTSSAILTWECARCKNDCLKPVVIAVNQKEIKCKRCSLSKDARKIYDTLLQLEIDFELEYTFESLKGLNGYPLRFDFAIFEQGNFIGLVEYDGGFHDTHETTQAHDQLKNQYCKDNNIPLLRIHHTEATLLHKNLFTFLKDLRISLDETIIKSIIHDEEIEKLQEQLSHHENKILEIKEKLTKLTTQGEI